MNSISIERKQEIEEYHLPAYREIPDVGLYREQVVKYINTSINTVNDVEITDSMISNYVKKKLVSNPIKKQYYREQIAYLIFIALTKSVLSLDNFAKLFKLQKEQYDFEKAYDLFSHYYNEYLHLIFEGEDNIDVKDNNEDVYLLKNIIMASIRNSYLNEWLND